MLRTFTLVVLLALTASVQAADPVTIGYVDMSRVIAETRMGKEAQASLEKKYAEPQKELGEEEQAIRQLQQKTNRDAALMSQAELDKRAAELQGRVAQLQRQAIATQQELGKDKTRLGGEIIKAARGVISKLAEERKLTAVFELGSSGLLYIQDALNITDEVIKRVDALPAN
jgi:outer membrane protein